MSQGKVVQIIGAVVDVEFPRENVPKEYDALGAFEAFGVIGGLSVHETYRLDLMEEGQRCFLYVGGDEVAVADSDSNGDVEFTYTSDVLAAGEYTVRLEADAEGASVELTLTVSADEVPAPVTIPD